MRPHKVIIFENQPILGNAYKLLLDEIKREEAGFEFELTIANTYEEGIKAIHNSSYEGISDILAILDIVLESAPDLKRSGEDLGTSLKRLYPKAKFIVATSITTKFRYHTTFQQISPEGFLIKSETDFKDTKQAIKAVLKGETYFSNTISAFLRDTASIKIAIDNVDRKLLYYLSQGTKIKTLSTILELSVSGIEWRQRRLAKAFDLENSQISGLVQKAKELGLV